MCLYMNVILYLLTLATCTSIPQIGDFTYMIPEKIPQSCFAKISNTVLWVEREKPHHSY